MRVTPYAIEHDVDPVRSAVVSRLSRLGWQLFRDPRRVDHHAFAIPPARQIDGAPVYLCEATSPGLLVDRLVDLARNFNHDPQFDGAKQNANSYA